MIKSEQKTKLPKYKETLSFVCDGLLSVLKDQTISSNDIKRMLDKYTSGVSYNTLKRHLNVLFNEAVSLGMNANPMLEIKSKKTKANSINPLIIWLRY